MQSVLENNNITYITPVEKELLNYIVMAVCVVVGAILALFLVSSVFYRLRLQRSLLLDMIRYDKGGFKHLLWEAIIGTSKKYKLQTRTYRDPCGIVIGLSENKKFVCSTENEEGHLYVNGGTGSGKTANILIPTLRVWQGNAYVIDISGDISKKTSKYRKNKVVFCPWSRQGMPYDVYHPIRQYQAKQLTPVAEDAINDFFSKLSFCLVPDDVNIGDNERYFRNGGRSMLAAALVFYFRNGVDFVQSCREFVQLDAFTLLEKINYMDSAFIRSMTSGFVGENEKNVSGCKASANSYILIFATKGLLENHLRQARPGEQAIYPELIERRDIYIIIPERQLVDYAPLLALITSQMMAYIEQRKPSPLSKTILMCVDEFGRLGKLEKCKDFLQTARKRKARMIALGQSVADVEINYGSKEAESILDNFVFKVCLESNHPRTQEYFASLAGKDYERKQTQTISKSIGVSDSFSEIQNKDYIVEPASLQYLKRNNQLLYICPDGYAILQKYKYWHDRKRYPDDYVSKQKRK